MKIRAQCAASARRYTQAQIAEEAPAKAAGVDADGAGRHTCRHSVVSNAVAALRSVQSEACEYVTRVNRCCRR